MADLIKISPGAIVCKESELVGDITIGSKTVIHPKARIIAEAGPIIIGDGNIIEEQAVIINRLDSGDGKGATPVLLIGNNNVFEVDCHVEAAQIGDYNVIESKARVGSKTRLSNGCIIGAKCHVTVTGTLPENTMIYGKDCLRRTLGEKPSAQTLQLEFLSKILPNYHHLKKPSKKLDE